MTDEEKIKNLHKVCSYYEAKVLAEWRGRLKAEAKVEKLVEALRKIADCEEYSELDGSYAMTEEAFIARAALAEIEGDQK